MDLLTVHETATMLKINPETVQRYIASGRLPAVRVGRRVRVHKEAIEAMLAPVQPKDEPMNRGRSPFPAPSPAELARRQAAAAKIRAIRARTTPSKETSADLIRQVRAEEERSYGV